MKITMLKTDTYILTKLDSLDAVTVYVTNYKLGQGKIVIECFGDAWAHYWGAMGENTLQQFFVGCENGYIVTKLVQTTKQTDFDAINELAEKRGFDICVTSDVDIAYQAKEIRECFGDDWMFDLPRCYTDEYERVSRIVTAIKAAFTDELKHAIAV